MSFPAGTYPVIVVATRGDGLTNTVYSNLVISGIEVPNTVIITPIIETNVVGGITADGIISAINLTSQTINLNNWVAGSGGIVRGNDKTGVL